MTAKRQVKLRGSAGELARYLGAPYVRMIIPNTEEGGYLAEVLELPGCITEGDTPEEAYRNLEDAMAGWIAASLDTKRPIPEPVGDKEYSGHFPLRMSTELHRAAALRAMQEGISLNQWIVGAIAAQVTGQNLVGDLADQIAAKVIGRISMRVSGGVFWSLAAATLEDFVQGTIAPSRGSSAATTAQDVMLATVGRSIGDAMMDAVGDAKEVNQNA